ISSLRARGPSPPPQVIPAGGHGGGEPRGSVTGRAPGRGGSPPAERGPVCASAFWCTSEGVGGRGRCRTPYVLREACAGLGEPCSHAPAGPRGGGIFPSEHSGENVRRVGEIARVSFDKERPEVSSGRDQSFVITRKRPPAKGDPSDRMARR